MATVSAAGICSVNDCTAPVRSRGLCNRHYKRLRLHGDVHTMLKAHSRAHRGEPCTEPACEAPATRRGMCATHYYSWWKVNRPTCSVTDCDEPVQGRGLCARHRQRLVRFGDPLAGPAFRSRRGQGMPRWVYQDLRDEDRAQLTASDRAYAEILRLDPCAYCGGPASEIDHIDPFIAGGRFTVQNITASCGPCNRRKQHTPLLIFLATREPVSGGAT